MEGVSEWGEGGGGGGVSVGWGRIWRKGEVRGDSGGVWGGGEEGGVRKGLLWWWVANGEGEIPFSKTY